MGQGRAGAGKSRHAATHVVMGRIGAPWGVKGWVKVFSFTEPAGNLLDYRHFEIESGAQLVPVEFDELKPHGSGFVGHIRGCDVREASGAFTGRELWLAKSALPQIGEGYYWHQLEGLRVVNLQDITVDIGNVGYQPGLQCQCNGCIVGITTFFCQFAHDFKIE